MRRNIDEHADDLARYLPDGDLWRAKWVTDSVLRLWCRGLAYWQQRVDLSLREFREHILPDETQLYLDEWERALGIPDGCFTGTGTELTRRRDINVKIASLGVQTATDFESLGAMFGALITVNGGMAHLPVGESGYGTATPLLPNPPLSPPASQDSFANPTEARFTVVVAETTQIGERFTYSFPLPFTSQDRVTMQCLIEQLVPANCQVFFVTA